MDGMLRSVNVGSPAPGAPRGRLTGFDKRPVASVEVRDPGPRAGGLGSGVVGDAVVNRRHHGGERQAVYAVAHEELRWWADELCRDLADGAFGENLTTSGYDVDAAVVGEQWVFEGGVVLEVTGPRIPCATFARAMGERGWVKRFTARGRSGAYLAVRTPGTLTPGEGFTVRDRPAHGVEVPTVFRALMGDPTAARAVLDADVLPEPDRTELAARLPTDALATDEPSGG